jgi:hypothetical protein
VFIGGEGHGVVIGVSLHVSESSPEEDMMMLVILIGKCYRSLEAQDHDTSYHGLSCSLFINDERRRKEWDRS